MSLCVLCPGQGSQSLNMFDRLRNDPLAEPVLQAAWEHLPGAVRLGVSESTCYQTNAVAQPALVLYAGVVGELLRQQGVVPALVSGYSVGELSAQVVAGKLSTRHGIELAALRAQRMDDASPVDHGLMAIKGMRMALLETLLPKLGEFPVAIYNDEQHCVVGGGKAALASLGNTLQQQHGAHVVHLCVKVPSHTHWLKQASVDFARDLQKVTWLTGDSLVLSGLAGRVCSAPQDSIDCLARQLSEPLYWGLALDMAVEQGATVFFETGPGNTLSRMVRERFPDLPCRSLSDFKTVQGALDWLLKQGVS
ncbi:acyltransferase domain-containing protein [Limnobacter sp.]|uniref:acyltransferase domain-containing protein n=1 Tax=Limnobacter sp. TaxID=2003368 RepID=UPI0025854CD3|nr:acyltransferase domain-containing protein [Limnobacter sp.]